MQRSYSPTLFGFLEYTMDDNDRRRRGDTDSRRVDVLPDTRGSNDRHDPRNNKSYKSQEVSTMPIQSFAHSPSPLPPCVALVTLAVLSAVENASARIQWLERDDRAVRITGRRFGQEHPAVIDKLSGACAGQICGNLAGQAITPLLAAQPECSQQDMADAIIDAALTQDDATKANMIQLAIEYRQVEKNTPPDFSVQPPANRNSVFCQKAPKHAELNNLVQAQDPANDPQLFFDPASKATVKLGSQANTKPFVVGNGSAASNSTSSDASATASASASASDSATSSAAASSAVLVATSAAATDDCVVTVTVTADATATAAATSSAAASTSTGAASNIGNFGSCSVPQIEFGVGFDNRKETSFQPVDKASFNHGSAQAIGIISQFICDTLTNSCKADQTAKDTCKQAQAAGNAAPAKTGAAADAFNAVFGIKTNFAAVQEIDDQGRPVAGTGSAAATSAANNAAAATTTSAAAASTSAASTGSSSAIGNFGSCSVPQIEFGVGFDNRKETSFQPVDKASFNHGSAQAIGIISQFICDQLTNSCKADQTAKDTCKQAQAAGNAAPAKTGAAADAFNAVFGIKTNFAAVQAIDDQGRPVAGTGSDAAANTAAAAATTTAAAAAATTTAAAAASTTSASSSTGSPSAIGDFGKCSVPKIEFGVGFDNRKETSFQPADKASYQHDSAQNGDIITQFMCDNLVNVCGADATAKATCAKAKAAFDTVTAKTGGQADAFNAVFGIKTNFAAVTPLDNQGNPVAAA